MSSILAAFDGRLGAAPQMRSTGQSQPWATFSVAVGHGAETEWVSVSAFGELATELPDDLAKGERVYCEGRLTVSRWEKGGEQRANLRLAASRILVLDRIGRRARRRRRDGAGLANGSAGVETTQASDAA
jgi:single-stranded DNA-binding protein